MKFPITLVLLTLLAAPAPTALAQRSPNAIALRPLTSGVDASFRGMAMHGAREAWLGGTGGTVIRTTDAGQTWQQITVPDTSATDSEKPDFRDIEILPDGTVLLMSIGAGSASKIFRSEDNGQTWQTVLVNSDPQGFFDGMAFLADGQTGWLFGDPLEGHLDLYRTNNAGKTWHHLPLSQRPKLAEGEYAFAASGTSIVARGQSIWIATGGSVARVWKSTDEGKTWQAFSTPIRSGNESSGIFSIDLIDDDRAVVIGGNYLEPEQSENNVATSTDGGKTWHNATGVSMPHKACVQSLGEGRLITCGRTGVAYSEDAGKTWGNLSTGSYYTLRVDKKTGTGFLAGKDGQVATFELLND
ncbi:WD40/YVTN/BNR-like repeat-containing protein [Rhodopirellula sp. MGV]|uniref:WD40/YVTN/BNR-like repeat-containing protein n=1 Tax=Rhodopirellula sp. MGV TaxID=2023130 RepID=UPI000B972F99|nr:hypothetical protein [Rhodopirellula sp. MGV]OYP34128.1 hypothetical protein CGZ80_15825 [Rhodopirellula sp. MGV]PNY33566.1 oxidoreductase [Rhodopirellula baltica]